MERKKRKKQFSFKADGEFMEKVYKKIDKENVRIKDRKLRHTLSSKILELLFDYESR